MQRCISNLGRGDTLEDCIQNVGCLSDEQILGLIQGAWSMQVKMLGRSDRLHPTERRDRVESFRAVLGVLVHRKVVLNNLIISSFYSKTVGVLKVIPMQVSLNPPTMSICC